jgi:hypothetical protein
MAKNKTSAITPAHKYINFKRVIDDTGIQQDKVYNNLKGEYHSFTPEENKKIFEALSTSVKEVFKNLGYAVNFSRIKD